MTRVDPPLRADETETLLAFLAYHRDTFRGKVAGLDADQLGRTIAASTMTLGGMISHLTLVEDNWFSVVLAGNDPAPPWNTVDWEADNDWDWHSAAASSPADLLAAYEDAVVRADTYLHQALAHGGWDAESARTSRRSGVGKFSLRWIVLHMIEEYARHNGHADLYREAIDGTVGE